jgi:hypothetical protein
MSCTLRASQKLRTTATARVSRASGTSRDSWMWRSNCTFYRAAYQIYPEFSDRVVQSESLTPRTLLTVVPSAWTVLTELTIEKCEQQGEIKVWIGSE